MNISNSISQLLKQSEINLRKNAFISNIAKHITSMKEPTKDWEKVSLYAIQTGQPLSLSLDNKNQVSADIQYARNTKEQKVLDDIAEISNKIQANKKNEELVNSLKEAEYRLSNIQRGLTHPTKSWEHEAISLMSSRKPLKIQLDKNGDIMIQDQLIEDNSDLDYESNILLRKAVEEIPSIINEDTLTKNWHADAKNFTDNKIPYYLTIDPVTKEISAVENNGDNITPEFLKTPPYPNLNLDTQWKKKASELIENNKPFYVDFTGGKTEVKELTAMNLINMMNPSKKNTGTILDFMA